MIRKFFSKIGNKIVFFTGFTLFSLAVVLTSTFTIITYQSTKEQTREVEEELMASFDRLLQSQIETAITMLQGYADKVATGELTDETARKLAADVLRGITYGNGDYFWADNQEGVNIVLPGKKEVEGTNRLNQVDAHGNNFIKEILAAGMKGGGFTEYWFPKLGETEPSPKRSYSKLFEPFGWVTRLMTAP